MTAMEGEMFKSRITEDLFKIKKVEDGNVVMLEDEKGYVRIWLHKEGVESLFEKVRGCPDQ